MTKLNIKMYGRSLYVYTLNKLLLLLLLSLFSYHILLSWCQISGKIQEQRFYSDQTHTAFQEDLKYSDFF